MEHEWWEVASVVLSNVATVVVAVFAGVQIWREKKRREQVERGAKTVVSARAYLIRRRLRTWLGSDPESEEHLETWVRETRNAKGFVAEIRSGELAMTELISLLGEAPKATAEAAREAFVFFLEGSRRLVQYAATPRPTGTDFFDWIQLRHDAAADLRDCLARLETNVIEPALLNSETILTRKREDEEPFNQLAQAILAAERSREIPSGQDES